MRIVYENYKIQAFIAFLIIAIVHLLSCDVVGYFDSLTYFFGFRDAIATEGSLSFRMQASPMYFYPIGALADMVSLSPFLLARIVNTLLVVPIFVIFWSIGARILSKSAELTAFACFLIFTPMMIYTFCNYYYDAGFNLLQALALLATVDLWRAADRRKYRRALLLGVVSIACAELVRGQGLALPLPFAAIVLIHGIRQGRGRIAPAVRAAVLFVAMIAPYVIWTVLTRSVSASPSAFAIGYLDGINRLFGYERYAYDLAAQTFVYKAPPVVDPYGLSMLMRKGTAGAVALLFGEVLPQFVSFGSWPVLAHILRTHLNADLLLLPVFLCGAGRWLRAAYTRQPSDARDYLVLCAALFGPLWISETFIQVRGSYYTSLLFPLAFFWVQGLMALQGVLRRLEAMHPGAWFGSPAVIQGFVPMAALVPVLGGVFYVMEPAAAAYAGLTPDYANIGRILNAGGPREILIDPLQQEKFSNQIVPFGREFFDLTDGQIRTLLRGVAAAVIPEKDGGHFADRVAQAGGTAVRKDIPVNKLSIYSITFGSEPAIRPGPS